MVVAGDIKSITYNHPTKGTGTLFPKANEDFTFDTGGYRGDDDANLIDGGQRNIKKLNQVKPYFEGPVTWDMNFADELTKMSDLAGDPVDADWTIESVNGTVWGMKGSPVGDIQGNTNEGTMNLKVSGGGRCVKIVG